jgi:hypothetical protein
MATTRAAMALAALAALGACAQPARAPRMAVHDVMSSSVTAGGGLEESFTVGGVSGGSPTNGLWTPQIDDAAFREALERSLAVNRMLAALPDSARYVVFARLLEVERPVVGLSMRVAPRVAYRVFERGAPGEVFDDEIVTVHTARFGDAMLGAERLRLANEGAIRESIREFLNRFHAAWLARQPPPPEAPSPDAAAPEPLASLDPATTDNR